MGMIRMGSVGVWMETFRVVYACRVDIAVTCRRQESPSFRILQVLLNYYLRTCFKFKSYRHMI